MRKAVVTVTGLLPVAYIPPDFASGQRTAMKYARLLGLCLCFIFLPSESSADNGGGGYSEIPPVTVLTAGFTSHTEAVSAGAKEEEKIEVLFRLKLRDEQGLDELLRRQSDPLSPQFRKWITPQEFVERHSPEQSVVDEVVAHLKSKGLEVTRISANRLLIWASGTNSQLKAALSQPGEQYHAGPIHRYTLQGSGRTSHPLSAVLAVIIGLEEQQWQSTTHAPSSTPPEDHPGLSPQLVSTTYSFPNANNQRAPQPYGGEGNTIAIISFGLYSRQDVEQYWQAFGIRRTGTITDVVFAGGPPLEKNNLETTLDLEQAGAQAPGADILMYLGNRPDSAWFTKILDAVVNEDKAQVVSISWSFCETDSPSAYMPMADLFKQGAVQGMAFFSASGDRGAYRCSEPSATSAACPASDPNVTAVGGTSLTLSTDGTRRNETAWSGSGGAASGLFARPLWQLGVGPAIYDFRLAADVALVSDPNTGYATYHQGQWQLLGGTSFAAPNWAAFWTLASQASGIHLGPANPALYRICTAQPGCGGAFLDITAGANGGGQGTGLPAGPGWDYPTGWGVPNGVMLIEQLSGFPPISQRRAFRTAFLCLTSHMHQLDDNVAGMTFSCSIASKRAQPMPSTDALACCGRCPESGSAQETIQQWDSLLPSCC